MEPTTTTATPSLPEVDDAGVGDRLGGQPRETVDAAALAVSCRSEGFDWFENSPPAPAADIAMLKLDHVLNSQPIQLAGKPTNKTTRSG